MPDVLFVCVHNAGRSRIAEAVFKREAAGRWTAASAGTQPADRPHPEVVAALAEVGIDLDDRPGTLLTPELVDAAGRLVSMGCALDDACPAAATPMTDWALADPKGRPPAEVRRIRDEISARVRDLIAELDAGAAGQTAGRQPT
ncbi:MAG TPA: low molecular weight phosphatase family protein [Egibacteraceae bacterium]|nr:low molecular weight phosphatase family protein [Egibacteraceae bacterium]